jgi:hypothetical protein
LDSITPKSVEDDKRIADVEESKHSEIIETAIIEKFIGEYCKFD